jgi:hypothetical protein
MIHESAAALAHVLEEEMARRAAETDAAPPEPGLPAIGARFATEPIRGSRGTVDSGVSRSSNS